jgi:hypothetical protein
VSEPLLIQAEHFLYSHRCSYSWCLFSFQAYSNPYVSRVRSWASSTTSYLSWRFLDWYRRLRDRADCPQMHLETSPIVLLHSVRSNTTDLDIWIQYG